ncbi:hypothetical protein [Chryseobacterium sp. SIMBA_028]|uniref:hypothetical protein n=1 Tax=Chryseobacterium sp. SIMBA_028 TaxID=3085771 RepID=UPI003979E2B7
MEKQKLLISIIICSDTANSVRISEIARNKMLITDQDTHLLREINAGFSKNKKSTSISVSNAFKPTDYSKKGLKFSTKEKSLSQSQMETQALGSTLYKTSLIRYDPRGIHIIKARDFEFRLKGNAPGYQTEIQYTGLGEGYYEYSRLFHWMREESEDCFPYIRTGKEDDIFTGTKNVQTTGTLCFMVVYQIDDPETGLFYQLEINLFDILGIKYIIYSCIVS